LKRMISNTVLLWKKTPVQRITAAELDLMIAIIIETPQYDFGQEITREVMVDDDDDPCSLEFGQQDLSKSYTKESYITLSSAAGT